MTDPVLADVRALLEKISEKPGHKFFRLRDGTAYEGTFFVDEDEDVIQFGHGVGPFDDRTLEDLIAEEPIQIAIIEIDLSSLRWSD